VKILVTKGDTSRREYVFIQDSSVTTGAGLTGLVYNASNLVASYVREGSTRTAITLATQTVSGAYSSGGFVEVDATNMPGVYRFDIPDAAFATGVDKVVVMLKGAANMVPVVLEYQLINADLEDSVRLGLTALPNAAAGASGGVPLSADSSGNAKISGSFKKNTALAKFMFLMTDSTNHAPATGKTVTCTRSLDGAAFGSGTLGTPTEVANGIYYVDFASGDMNGNVVTLRATATGCDDTFVTLVTTP
jgi:hypothetical protein